VRDVPDEARLPAFPAIPAIVENAAKPIDQMKLFELIPLVPSPTWARSNRATCSDSSADHHDITCATKLSCLSGKPTGCETSATIREVIGSDVAVQNEKFERALAHLARSSAGEG